MRIGVTILILTATGFFSCKQSGGSAPDAIRTKTSDSAKDIQNKKTFTDKDIYTKHEYIDPDGRSLIIQNGFPRGGVKYTDSNGNDYNYAVFWTQITNDTDSSLELQMNVPANSYEVPSLPGKYYKVLIPADTMSPEKFPLFMYGLKNLESFLDNNIHKSASLRRTINSKESSAFYFVILCLTEGAHGTMRTELNLQGQNLFYRIKIDGSKSNRESTDRKIRCGSINLKNLMLQK